ncbi:unnamed protein product, partial [Ectocarpus fasciculatus]
EPPSPWWFNSVTGESTWDCPNVQVGTDAAADGSSLIVNDEGEDGVQPQQQLTVAGGEANDWQMYYDEESADEPIPWWFNSVT